MTLFNLLFHELAIKENKVIVWTNWELVGRNGDAEWLKTMT